MLNTIGFCVMLLLFAPCLLAQTTATVGTNILASTGSSSSSSYEPAGFSSGLNVSVDTASTSISYRGQWVQSYCMGHPGEDWTRSNGSMTETGHCPAADQKSIAVLHSFLAHHRKIAPSPVNTRTLIAYVNYNRLNPLAEKSYEKAYKELRNTGQLELYK